MKKLTKFLTVFLLALLGANLQPAWASNGNEGTSITFYAIGSMFDGWNNSTSTLKVDVRRGGNSFDDNPDALWSQTMTNTGLTYHGYTIYSFTFKEKYDGAQIRLKHYQGSTWKADYAANWEGTSTMQGKIYLGWHDPSHVWVSYYADHSIAANSTVIWDLGTNNHTWSNVYMYRIDNGTSGTSSTHDTYTRIASTNQWSKTYSSAVNYMGVYLFRSQNGSTWNDYWSTTDIYEDIDGVTLFTYDGIDNGKKLNWHKTSDAKKLTSGKKIYFDNTNSKWSAIHLKYGTQWFNRSRQSSTTKVTGTDNLYVITMPNDAYCAKWYLADGYGWTDYNDIETYNNIGNRTHTQTSDLSEDITFVPSSGAGSSPKVWEASTFSGHTRNVTITTPTNGSITVTYTDENGTNQIKTSGSFSVAQTCILTISTSGAEGYHLDELTVTGATLKDGKYIVTDACSISATFAENMHTASIAYMCESSSIKEKSTSGKAGIATTTAITAPEITGYTFSSWATLPSGATTSNQLTDATINVNLTADDLTITANYTRNATYDLVVKAGTHVTTVTGGVTGETTVPFTKEISATAFDNGYEFSNWTANPEENAQFASGTSATTNVTVQNGSVEVTANAKATTYSITYNGVDPSEHTNPTTYTIETATITLSDASRVDYTFDGWFDAETEGDKVTEIAQGSTGDKTLWARWHETLHSVNIVAGMGIDKTTPAGATDVGNVTSVQIEATVKEGYTWKEWTTSSVNVTIANASSINTSIKATGTGTVTATATEILLPLATSANESYMGTVEKTKEEIGVATTSTLTASSANRNYKFKQWNLTNCTITSGTVNNATITVKGDGVNNPSAEAEFEVAWLISGNTDISTDWGASGVKMTVVSDGVFKYEFNATKVASDNGDYNFKVYNTTRNAYYANKEGDSGWWFTRGANSTTLAEDAQSSTNMSLRSDMVGNYIFTLDCSTSRVNPILTVTFPTTTTYDVDIYYDGVTKTTVEGGSFTKQITAQVPESMQFDHWEVEGETTHVSITNAQSQTTTFTASGTGAIIRAKFNTNKRIYLKGGSNFSSAYMNFYKSDYFDANLGSGNNSDLCVGKNWEMYKVTNTDIFWLNISSAPDTWNNYFSFVNKSGDYNNFSMCNVVYRSDMKDALPFYVPRNSYASEHHNTSQYFNEGIWMKYNDTYSGYKLHIIETGSSENDYYFNAETPGGYEFKTTVSLKTGVTYKFKIVNENNTWYGVTGQTMTATSCTNWKMHLNNEDCQITTSEAGNYTFILNLGSGEVIISVEYPLSQNDYRVVAKLGDEVKWEGDLIKNSGTTAKKDTTSFFNNNYTYQLQQYAGGDTWDNVGSEVTIIDDKAQVGVITLIVTQDGNGSATLAYEGVYTGNYYIRTDGVDGGWGDYENNSDNKMDNYGSLIDADPEYQYDVYKAKWITSGKNVKFRIANDYSKAISDELKGDAVIGNDKETLPQSANVRFMWNSTTNQLKRAYLSGSSNASDRYLILEGDAKMFDENGDALTTEGGGKIEGLNDYELNFDDKNNWVYQADIKAQPGCAVKLTAKYNGIVQYFIGKEGNGDDSRRKIIDGSGTDKYNLRAVYDFKTNRLVVGWMPGDTIKSSIELGSDMLIERTEQGDASQIVFGGESAANLSISKIQHIYGVLKLTKESMLAATATTYGKCIYWISFPFDVKVSEIFGVEKYGEVWVISNYRGDLRAQKGWFKEDTPTFWEYLKPTDIMKANVGYTLNLDPDYFNKETSEPWKSGAEEVAWYFPSMQENIGVVSLAQKDTTLLPQHCEIDREFNAGTEESLRMVNHKFTDSNWRVIGVPAFQNLQAPTFAPAPTPEQEKNTFGLTGFYEWQPSTNTYTAHTTDGYTFKATGAYMVQYEGKITWSDASAITTTKAPWHASADSKSYSIKLEFGNEAYTDQTFVTLTEKASTDFVLNEDMMKIDNAGFPNIYSFAGNYNVAYNETKMDNQTVTLGVSAPKAGTYTFAMPNQFSGTAKLIDLVEGITTDLNISDYSVDLNKGTYNDRFQLLLEVEAKAPTSVEATGDRIQATGKTTKLLRNGNIYLINAGRVYNATGTMVR